MKVTRYKIIGPKLKAAVAADLHGEPTEELITALKAEKPDVILIPGDLATVCENHDHPTNPARHKKILHGQKAALEFLKTAAETAPVYYSRGNHETWCSEEYREKVRESGAVLLENEWREFNGLYIGGQNPARRCAAGNSVKGESYPDTEWLKHSPQGYKLLLCHNPEYCGLVEHSADIVISGHTHGGQWRFFGHGVFAPGQGLFPKYSRGQYGKMIVSAGLTNTVKVPRLFNPTELLILEFGQP